VQGEPFTHSAVVWQACADAWVLDVVGVHLLPWLATFWHVVPAEPVVPETSAKAQQTSPEGQSVFCRHPNEADSDGHVDDLGTHDACSVSVRQQMFLVRSQAAEPQSGTPAELNMTGLGTRCPEPPLELEPLLDVDPPLEPDEPELELLPELDDPPELDPLELDASSESSPPSGLFVLLLHAGVDAETRVATAQGPSPRSHGYRRAASRRAVM
jgi:hypothetical protein